MKRGKKAQVIGTFVVIGIVIIAVVLLGFLLYRYVVPQTPAETGEIKVYVQNCLDDTFDQAILFAGQQGGYAEPKKYLETDLGSITYWIHDNIDYRPSAKDFEETISKYIQYVLPMCINSFAQFSDLNVTEGNLTVESNIEDNSIDAKISYPLKITKEDVQYELNYFSSSVQIRFLDSYNLAIQLSSLNNDIVEINKIDKKELNSVVLQYSEEDYLYVITDNITKLLDQPFNLVFAIK